MVLRKKNITCILVLSLIAIPIILVSCLSGDKADYFTRFHIAKDADKSLLNGIRTDGIYTYYSDYISDGIIFFEDGSFAEIVSDYDLKKGYSLYQKFTEKNRLYIFFQGLYNIKGDSLFMDRYCKIGFSWRCDHYNMRLLSNDTIEVLSLDVMEEYGIENIPYTGRKMHFEPLDTIPMTSLMPIKKQRWLWENKTDWKNYLVKWKKFKKDRKNFPIIVDF